MKKLCKNNVLGFILLILLASACGSDHHTNPQGFTWDAHYADYPIAYLNYEERYFYWENPIGLELDFLHDSDGIRVVLFEGQYVYHPWTLSNMALQYINGYYVTQDSAYLDFCRKYKDKLSEIGVRFNNGIYFPYTFNYCLHNGTTNDVMMAPWFSGIAEGYTLSFLSKYYELTNDAGVLAFADSVFNTFLNTDKSADIWTCLVDSSGYYWIEEYPYEPQTHVFGGFTSGLIGIYNYYLVTHDPRSLILLKSSLSTIENYAHEYRNPGGISYYCLLHRGQIGLYHLLNIDRLRYLARLSDDSIFNDFADSLEADYSGGILNTKFEHEIEDNITNSGHPNYHEAIIE